MLWYALDSIFVIVFLVFFFALDGNLTGTAGWISFSAILLSYFLMVATPLFVKKGAAETDYRRPLFVISLIYFGLTFIIGVITIIINPEKSTTTILINVALLGLYAIVLLTNLIANEHIAEQEATREIELKYVKEASMQLGFIKRKLSDNDLRIKVQEAYDLISSSPVHSSPSVQSIEASVMQEIADIDGMDASEHEAISKSLDLVISLASKRNLKLQTENRNR